MDDRNVPFEFKSSDTEKLSVEEPVPEKLTKAEDILKLPEQKLEHQDDYKDLTIEQFPLENRDSDEQIYSFLRNDFIPTLVPGALDPDFENLPEERIRDLESEQLLLYLTQTLKRNYLHAYVSNRTIGFPEILPPPNLVCYIPNNEEPTEFLAHSLLITQLANIEHYARNDIRVLMEASVDPVKNLDYSNVEEDTRAFEKNQNFLKKVKDSQDYCLKHHIRWARDDKEYKELLQDILIAINDEYDYDSTMNEESQHRVEFWKTYFKQGYNPEHVKTEVIRRTRKAAGNRSNIVENRSYEESSEEGLSQMFDQEAKADNSKPKLESEILNSTQDMEYILDNELNFYSHKGDKYAYTVFATPFVKDTIPSLLGYEKDTDLDNLSEEQIFELFINETLKWKYLEALDARVENLDWGPTPILNFYKDENVKSLLQKSGSDLRTYTFYMASLDIQINGIVNALDEVIMDQLENKDIQDILAENNKKMTTIFAAKKKILENIQLEKASHKTEIANWFRTHLKETVDFRNPYEQFSLEAKRRTLFWKDFVENGYDKEKAIKEASRRSKDPL